MNQNPNSYQHEFEDKGYFIVKGLVAPEILTAMEQRVIELVELFEANESIGDAILVPEKNLSEQPHAKDRLSKLFRIHRHEEIFRQFCESKQILDLIRPILGDNLDCFLSQFIFKHPGSLGQPWHQDRYYFNFDRSPQLGLWLAITEAHENNGPLWVLPGSHKENIHLAIKDKRKNANPFYVEIVDHNMDKAECVCMQPGDGLFFHSHLMHKSTDNLSNDRRAAMVYHYADSATIDLNIEKLGHTAPNMDWLPVHRTTT